MTTTHISNERLVMAAAGEGHEASVFYPNSSEVAAIASELLAARQTIAAMSEQQLVAEVISKYGDPEAFGERELSLLADIQKMPYDTKLYAAPQPAVVQDGWLLIPAKPSQEHLNSIAMRYRHDFYLLNDAQKDSALATARQMYEECSGQGFFNIPSPD